jgi:hypothetical protein
MRANSAVAIALQLPLFAVASTHRHAHNHAEAHRRALTTEVHVVTETVYTTVTVKSSSAAATVLSSSSSILVGTALPHKVVSSVATSVASPSTPPVASPSATYKVLDTEPENAIIKNSCGYDVYVWSVGDSSCSSGTNGQLLSANSTYREPIHKCKNGGIALKVCKTKDMVKPVQFEYAVWDDKKTVSYDISYLDCMKNNNGEQDLSACAGHDGGIQAAGGTDCPTYQCVAKEWCALKAYVVAEFGYQPGAPVGACTIEKGVAFELCASNRS